MTGLAPISDAYKKGLERLIRDLAPKLTDKD
jgi:hypothetical protein